MEAGGDSGGAGGVIGGGGVGLPAAAAAEEGTKGAGHLEPQPAVAGDEQASEVFDDAKEEADNSNLRQLILPVRAFNFIYYILFI